MLFYILILVIAFLLGSVPWGLVISKVFYGKDLREEGSGNIGTTNAIRSMGKVGGYAVFVLDFGKGLLSGFIGLSIAQAAGMDPSDPAVISFDQTYQPEKMTLRRVHLMVNPYEGTGKRLEIDKKRFRALQRRYGDAVKRYAAEKEEIFRQYREAAMEFAGEEFWRAYLGIQPEKNRKMKGEKIAGTGS